MKRRKLVIIITWIFAIASIGYGICLLKDFPLSIPFQQSVAVRENQVTLIKAVLGFIMGLSAFAFAVFLLRSSLWSFAIFFILSLLVGGIMVYSDFFGFGIVKGRGLGAGYRVFRKTRALRRGDIRNGFDFDLGRYRIAV
jgi:hypothetical protein